MKNFEAYYDKRLKCNYKLFKIPEIIPAGRHFLLSPIRPQMFEFETKNYFLNCKSDEIRRYLPSAYAETEEDSKKILFAAMQRMLLSNSLFYCIIPIEEKYHVGYINANSPVATTGFDTWTIDFWIGDTLRNRGIMTTALMGMLIYLKKNLVADIVAMVDEENIKAQKVVEKVGFLLSYQEPKEHRRLIYKMNLQETELQINEDRT